MWLLCSGKLSAANTYKRPHAGRRKCAAGASLLHAQEAIHTEHERIKPCDDGAQPQSAVEHPMESFLDLFMSLQEMSHTYGQTWRFLNALSMACFHVTMAAETATSCMYFSPETV
eukprot:1369530-Pleurochrysis_carterae.AAC.4